MKLSTIIPVFLASLPTFSTADSFADSCDQYRIYEKDGGWVLQAKCPGQGYSGYSYLPLDNCIVNLDGQPTPRDNGGFSSSCRRGCSISVGFPTMTCICDPQPADSTGVDLDLTPTVSNNDGILECYGHKGTPTTEGASSTTIADAK